MTPSTTARNRAWGIRDILRRAFKTGALALMLAGGAHALRAQQPAPPKPSKSVSAPAARKPDSAATKTPVGAKAAVAASPKAAAKAVTRTASADTMLTKLAPRLDLRVGNENAGGLRLSGTVGIVVMMGLLTLLPPRSC